MRRTVSAVVVVGLVGAGLLTSAVPSASAAPPPTVSATSGVPGTEVEVSSTDCVTEDPDGDTFEFLEVRLVSGTAPGEVLAGAGGSELGTATLIIPDWIDPAEPRRSRARAPSSTSRRRSRW